MKKKQKLMVCEHSHMYVPYEFLFLFVCCVRREEKDSNNIMIKINRFRRILKRELQ